MNVLFIFDDEEKSSFFLYNLQRGTNRLIRFSPELPTEKSTLGSLYTLVPIEQFLVLFSKTFALDVRKYLILTKSNSLKAVAEAGLDEDGKILITVHKEFIALKNRQQFLPGKHYLSLEELDAYISYQIDEDGRLDVFERQEDIIRLMKQKTVRPKLTSITQKYGTVKEFSGNNLSLKDMIKMGTGYLAKGSAHMDKLNVPVLGSYSLSGSFPYIISSVDIEKNRTQLRQMVF
ncbi:hypothetical protein [Enterococcus sp. AZ072]|uniref:hypothetical protein n=1 Tax=unclassified Enterococcus TaxID=2608891 RepID=UPI003D2C0527